MYSETFLRNIYTYVYNYTTVISLDNKAIHASKPFHRTSYVLYCILM